MATVKCSQCNQKEVTSPKLTGELCTSCFFENKKKNSLSTLTERTLNLSSEQKVKTIPEIQEKSTKENKENTESEPEVYDIKKEHHPAKVNGNEIRDPNKKYCQSCIERGYGLKLATREWAKDYFICDDCFEPLVNALVDYDAGRAEIERVKSLVTNDTPFLNQFYDLIGRPQELRFTRSEEILQLKNRNDIFVHHAKPLVNMSIEEVKEQIENYQVMLFNIKIGLEPLTDYINKIKHEERIKANIEGVKKSKAEVTKAGKLTKEEKEAKALGMTLERYREMVKKAKEREFDKITGAAQS
jgi:hypothetical protein